MGSVPPGLSSLPPLGAGSPQAAPRCGRVTLRHEDQTATRCGIRWHVDPARGLVTDAQHLRPAKRGNGLKRRLRPRWVDRRRLDDPLKRSIDTRPLRISPSFSHKPPNAGIGSGRTSRRRTMKAFESPSSTSANSALAYRDRFRPLERADRRMDG